MKITVIGTGYVGLVTATCFAESGNDVIGIDTDSRKITVLNSGQLPIYEPGLLELVQRNLREGRLSFTSDLSRSLASAQLLFVAVGTPQAADGSADLSNLWSLAKDLNDRPVLSCLDGALRSPGSRSGPGSAIRYPGYHDRMGDAGRGNRT